jgi:hypothetical protein
MPSFGWIHLLDSGQARLLLSPHLFQYLTNWAMYSSSRKVILPLFFALIMCGGIGSGRAQSIPLSAQKLEPVNVKLEDVAYKGKKAVRVIALDGAETMAIIRDKAFENGVIEIDVAGTTLSTASVTARGFIGLAFRVRRTDSVRYGTSAFTSAPPTAEPKINSEEIIARNTFRIPHTHGPNSAMKILACMSHTLIWWKQSGRT